jgi:hypothetical protein
MNSKESVKNFWNDAACGEKLLLPSFDIEGFKAQSAERYRLEPYIIPFADFASAEGLGRPTASGAQYVAARVSLAG